MNFVDVAAHYSPLRADGGSLCCASEEEARFHGGIQADLGAWRVKRADLVLFTGLRLSVRNDDALAYNAWEVPAEGGWRWSAPDALVRPYWELGGGPHLYLLLVEHVPGQVDVGMGTHTALGLVIGRGKVRFDGGVRAGAVWGWDQISGSVTGPDGTDSFGWSPLSAQVDGYVGVEIR